MSGKNPTEVLAPGEAGIARTVELLQGGGIVALPTETVYGLAARADSEVAVGKIYSAKGRPDFNPLIVHVANMETAESLAIFDDQARLLAERYWPGPLTLVLPLRPGAAIAAAVTAGLSTIALRMPAHPLMRSVLMGAGVPLAAPSANRSGAISPTEANHVIASLGGRIDAVLDGGRCQAGLESTIVALRGSGGWQLLRPGPIAVSDVAKILGAPQIVSSTKIEAPGQLASHYSPGKPLRLDATSAETDEFLIGFGAVAGDCTLSASGDLAEAAGATLRVFAFCRRCTGAANCGCAYPCRRHR